MNNGTYVITRSFNGLNIPVPFQNLILRAYLKDLNIVYSLPEVEHKFENCFMSLFTLIEKVSAGGNIFMVSLEILPSNNKFNEIASKLISKGIAVHGVLEKKNLRSNDDFRDYIRLRRFSVDYND